MRNRYAQGSKNLLFTLNNFLLKFTISLIAFIFLLNSLQAQTQASATFTPNSPPSDYYFNITWNYTPQQPIGQPNCNPLTGLTGAAYVLAVDPIDNDNSTFTPLQTISETLTNFPLINYNVAAGNYVDQAIIGPKGLATVICEVSEQWDSGCYGPGFWSNLIGGTSQYTNDDVYPASNLEVNFSQSTYLPTITWQVETHIPANTYRAFIKVTSPDDPDILNSFQGYGQIDLDVNDPSNNFFPKSLTSITPTGYRSGGVKSFKPCYTYDFEFLTVFYPVGGQYPAVLSPDHVGIASTFSGQVEAPPLAGNGVISGAITIENTNPPVQCRCICRFNQSTRSYFHGCRELFGTQFYLYSPDRWQWKLFY